MKNVLSVILFLGSMFLLYFFDCANLFIAIGLLVGTVVMTTEIGSSAPTIFMLFYFSLLVGGSISDIFLLRKPEKILEGAAPNVYLALYRTLWLFLAAFMFYRLTEGNIADAILPALYWVVAATITIGNLPFLVWHLSLLSEKQRLYWLTALKNVRNARTNR